MASSIVALGFGSFGGAAYVPTLGFSAGEQATGEPPEGLHLTAADHRPHYSPTDHRLHYVAADNRPHYEVD